MSISQLNASYCLDSHTEICCSFRSSTQQSFAELHNHDFYEITLVTAGSVKHYINGTEQIIPCGTVVYIRPEDTHFFSGIGSNQFEYINLCFSQKTLQDLFLYLNNGFEAEHYKTAPMPPMIHLSPSETQDIRQNLEKFNLISADDYDRKKAYLRLALSDLFYRYFNTPHETKKYHPLWLNELIHNMNTPENFRQGTSRLEELSGKTPAYISRIFKENLNTTPTDYINDLRLNYCANKLIYSDAEIIDIALDAGFNNLSHFYHLFKEKYHITPHKYRKENVLLL